MSVEQNVAIADIHVRHDARPIDLATVDAIKESIRLSDEGEPLHAPVVRIVDDGFELIDGHHRLRAMADLGNTEIKVSVVTLDDLHAELMMIDGNLCRSELTGIQRDQQTARRKVIYEELHPETRREATLRRGDDSPSRQVGETGKTDRFTAATAAVTGQSERSVQRSAERGEKIVAEAAELMKGTRLDTGAYANSIKDLPAEKQVAKVKSDLAKPPAPKPTKSVPPQPEPKPAPAGPTAFERFVELADEIEALRIGDLIASAGKKRSTLGQRASGLSDFADSIMEGLNR